MSTAPNCKKCGGPCRAGEATVQSLTWVDAALPEDDAIKAAHAGLQDSSRRIVALEAELAALREVAEAAREAFDNRNESWLGPVRMNDLGHALAKVPK